MHALVQSFQKQEIPYFAQAPIAPLTTFRIGGCASLLVRPQSIGQLIDTVRYCKEAGKRYVLLGRGSNVLFDDRSFDGVLIHTAALHRVYVNGHEITAECGASMMRLADTAAAHGLCGFSFAAGIPGSIGGGVYMNAGAHGKSILDCTKSVTFYDPDSNNIKTLFNRQLNNCYRKSFFQGKKLVILSVTLALLANGDPPALRAEIRALRAARRATQPLELPSAGSVFRRPNPTLAVGKMLEELGLKGMRIGDAEVSKKHAGFIVNLGAASFNDVAQLMRNIQQIVQNERGIALEPELCVILSHT